MSAMLLRVLIFAALALFIGLSVRKIWRDWQGQFKAEDEEKRRLERERDLRERQRPDVIDLKRDEDGTFRPGDDDNRR
ncbi:hypothetical protein [Devosia sp. RR2S18]|jgi:hypothetical protein|uniref:hypothetical protein n=1 Tax=Devosia rhizosphaerae TaxID=3049774 RepID=UPI00254142CD|nr:hypothetical protein [Devosia sp. RR2S18]WIJ24562.1 hypothetical protein QOV41_16310 [Devosia sp. RR2S18]